MYLRIKENEQKSIQNYYFKLFFKHITTNSYIDFDYDPKNELLLVSHTRMSRVKKLLKLVEHLQQVRKENRGEY